VVTAIRANQAPEHQEDRMTTPRDNLVAWLRDAYAMEGQAIELLESQIKRLENYPQAQPRLREHLEETKTQQVAIERCLEQLGESPSTLKEATMKLAANVQGMLHGLSGDEVLKHALGSHAFEQFEAGCYRSLSVAAEAASEPQIAQTCLRLMEQEQAMAAWVWEQIPGLTRTFLERDATGGAAKR
jgi:ferritin-like metal-binding protein YciE